VLLYDGAMPNAPRRSRTVEASAEAPAEPVAGRADYYWLVAGLMAAIGAFAGMLLLHYRNPPRVNPGSLLAASTMVYVLAQAIERILEPVNHFLHLGGDPAAATAPDVRARYRANRAAVCFGLASGLAMIACGYFGIGILHAIGDNGSPRYLDVVVTGLAVGGATKPLHDLITILERAARARQA